MNSPVRRLSLDHATWTLLAAMFLACLGFAWGKGFGIAWSRAVMPTAALWGLVLARSIGHRRGRPHIAAAATAFGQMTLFTVLGVVLAYTVAAHPAPLWDGRLAAADRAIGIDWPALLDALDRRPLLVPLLGLAYHSLSVQMVVVILALTKADRLDRLRVTVAAAVLSGFATILVSALMPAAGNLFDPDRYQHLWPSVAWAERDLIVGLRDGTNRVLDLSSLMGIVSFPSYHATLSALFIWSAWDVARLRWALIGWAALTIVATPIFGGHYAVEVIAGLLLAPPAIAIARLLALRLAAPPRLARPIAATQVAARAAKSARRSDTAQSVLEPTHDLA